MKKTVIKIINFIDELLIDVEIKNTLVNIIKYHKKPFKIIIFILVLPFSILFLIINVTVIILSLTCYFIIITFNIIKTKYTKKSKIIKYKKRFKFLKNFYLIIFQKILIEYPKKKSFLFIYIILKKISLKEKDYIEIEFIKKWIKSFSNRIFIKILLGVPFILIKVNSDLTEIIDNLRDFNYEDKTAFFNTVLLNIFKDVTPDYNKLIEKLKIKICINKLKFNSNKEIIKSLRFKKSFKEDFIIIKKKCSYASVKHIINIEKQTKYHPTLLMKGEKNKIIYINETSSKTIDYEEYNKEIKEYLKKKQENCHYHLGSVNSKKKTYYTKPIETNKENIILQRPEKNNFIKENIKKENINNITASFIINLESNVLLTKKIKEENKIVKEEKEKNMIEWIKENKINNDKLTFETILRIEFFWKENEEVIKNMSIEDKIKLAKILGTGIEEFENPKEINFLIFKSFISKDLKIK